MADRNRVWPCLSRGQIYQVVPNIIFNRCFCGREIRLRDTAQPRTHKLGLFGPLFPQGWPNLAWIGSCAVWLRKLDIYNTLTSLFNLPKQENQSLPWKSPFSNHYEPLSWCFTDSCVAGPFGLAGLAACVHASPGHRIFSKALWHNRLGSNQWLWSWVHALVQGYLLRTDLELQGLPLTWTWQIFQISTFKQ